MHIISIIVCLLALPNLQIVAQDCAVGDTSTAYRKLWTDLTKTYTRHLRPAVNMTQTTDVTVRSWIYNIVKVSELEESIQFTHWVRWSWQDQTLCWNPALYGDMVKITVPSDQIWVPDITIYQQLESLVSMEQGMSLVEISSDGSVSMAFNEIIKVKCQFNVAAFPFDEQLCKLTVSTWSYPTDEVHVISSNDTGLEYFKPNTEWDVTQYSGESQVTTYDTGDFWEVIWTLNMARRSSYYVVTLVFPSFAITTLCIIGLFAPFDADLSRQEKCTLGLTALLTMSFILLGVSDIMPKSASQFPQLGEYIIVRMAITSIGTIVAVCIMYCSVTSATGRSVPSWLLLATCLGGQRSYPEDQDRVETMENLNTVNVKKAKNAELAMCLFEVRNALFTLRRVADIDKVDVTNAKLWLRVCHRLDVMAMIIFLLVNIITTITFFIDDKNI